MAKESKILVYDFRRFAIFKVEYLLNKNSINEYNLTPLFDAPHRFDHTQLSLGEAPSTESFNVFGVCLLEQNVGKDGQIFVELLKKYWLSHIIVYPSDVRIELFISRKTNRLVYRFINNSGIDKIKILMKHGKWPYNIWSLIYNDPYNIDQRTEIIDMSLKQYSEIENLNPHNYDDFLKRDPIKELRKSSESIDQEDEMTLAGKDYDQYIEGLKKKFLDYFNRILTDTKIRSKRKKFFTICDEVKNSKYKHLDPHLLKKMTWTNNTIFRSASTYMVRWLKSIELDEETLKNKYPQFKLYNDRG